MRYNANELKHIAMASAKVCTKEGVLSLKEKEGKLWNKTDVHTERWCRLVDNMFFYFKTKEMSSDPHGVFLLEGSNVRPVTDENQGRAFILEFNGDSRSAYFVASEREEAQEWIKVLGDASYTKLKEKYESLLKQQQANEGQGTNSQQISVPSQEFVKQTRSANHSTFPVLELALSCVELIIPKAIDHKRQVQIRVSSLAPPATDWTSTFSSECRKAANTLAFVTTVSFFQSHLVTPHTQLRFQLCQHKENNSVSPLGQVTCAVSDLFYLTKPLVLEMEKESVSIGKLHVHVLREHVSPQLSKSSSESAAMSSMLLTSSLSSPDIIGSSTVDSSYGDIGQNPNLKSLYCEATSSTYKFPATDGSSLSVQEVMLESRLSFHIPHLYLKLVIDQETKYIGMLNSIKSLTERLQLSRTKHTKIKTSLLEKYQEAVKNIVGRDRTVSFKPSIQKTEKEYEFIPTNLHLQRMRVQHSNCMSALSLESSKDGSGSSSTGVYDILTVGAATAHCLKYKQGGLLSLIPCASEKLKKGSLYPDPSQNDDVREMNELPVTLPDLHEEVNTSISTLETLFQAGKECNKPPIRSSTETSLSNLSDKVCRLVSLLDNRELCMALHILLKQSNGPSSTSSLVNAATSLVSPSGIEWEEMKISAKTKLSEIIRKVHAMMDAADDFLSLRQEYSPPQFDDVLTDFKELSSRVNSIVNLAMEGHAIYIMQSPQDSPENIYRRDVVFSQVLSACVCGVATSLVSSLHDSTYLENVSKHGMVVHFESLLSTYKNELGMLEDYVVGMYDLGNVTFSCDRATERQDETFDHLLPTLHGTRNKVIVKLHLDATSFSKLPDNLKKGERFRIVPVMFNIGINEEQTLADKIGKSSLQDYLNIDSWTRLNKYWKDVRHSLIGMFNIDERLQRLKDAIYSKKNKNVEVLHLSAEIARMLKGVRITSCKSAKDRTAMSVTLEQVQVLLQNHELSKGSTSEALNYMRSQGTRRENTRKNVGTAKYAFTTVQLMTFPKQYKPPDGTYGKADS